MRVESIEFGGAPEPQVESLGELLSHLDLRREQFFATSRAYKRLPNSHNTNAMAEKLTEHAIAFGQAATFILRDDASNAEKGNMIATLLTDEDERRVGHFNSLIVDADFKPNTPEDGLGGLIKEFLDDVAQDTDLSEDEKVPAMLDEIGDHFAGMYEKDIGKFKYEVQSGRAAKLLQLGYTVGRHTLEVGKIGAGVALGVIVAKKIIRK